MCNHNLGKTRDKSSTLEAPASFCYISNLIPSLPQEKKHSPEFHLIHYLDFLYHFTTQACLSKYYIVWGFLNITVLCKFNLHTVICSFKMYKSMALIHSQSCIIITKTNFKNIFLTPKESPYLSAVTFHFQSNILALDKITYFPYLHIELFILNTSQKCYHTVYGLSRVLSFTQQNVFMVHP